MSAFRLTTAIVVFAILGGGGAASAGQLDRAVAEPLNRLLVAASQGCRTGNANACAVGERLNMMGNGLFAIQWDCERGDRNACYRLDAAADQLASEVRAMTPREVPVQTEFSPPGRFNWSDSTLARGPATN